MKFITKERIILHLQYYTRFENDFEVPDAISQEGIAEAVLSPRAHVSALLNEMEKEGAVYSRLAHVSRGFRRKNVYFLTDSGRNIAKELSEKIRKWNPGLLEDREALMMALAEKPKSTAQTPQPPALVDREQETEEINEFINSGKGRILCLYGLPGIGKTQLMLNIAALHNGLYICLPMPLHASYEFYVALAEALARKGRTKLKKHLTRNNFGIEAVFLAIEECAGLVICVDNAQYLNTVSDERLNLFWEKTKILLAGREKINVYNEQDVMRGIVKEMHITGLGERAARELLARELKIEEPGFQEIYGRAKGHPLLMLLISKGGTNTDWQYLFSEVFGALGESQKIALKMLALIHENLDVSAFIGIEQLSALLNKGLIYAVENTYKIHEVLRDIVLATMNPEEKKRIGFQVAQAIRKNLSMHAQKERIRILIDTGNTDTAKKEMMENYLTFLMHGELSFVEQAVHRMLEEERIPEFQCVLAEIQLRYGNWERALDILEMDTRGLAKYWQMERDYIMARANNLGTMFEKSLGICTRAYKEYRHPKFLLVKGRAYAGLNMNKKAIDTFLDALSKGAEQGIALAEIGNILIDEHEYGKAIEYFEKAMVYIEDGSIRNKIGINLAIAHAKSGNLSLACNNLEKIMKISRENGELINYGFAAVNLADIMLERGNYPDAERLAQDALHVGQKLNLGLLIASSLINLGKAQKGLGKIEDGERNIALGEERYREIAQSGHGKFGNKNADE